MMSFFQKCVCHTLIRSRLAGAPPRGVLNLGRMTGREIIHNLFTIADQRGRQNIPWKLKLILWITDFLRVSACRVVPGRPFGEPGRVELRGVLRPSRTRGGPHRLLWRERR